VSAPHLPRSPVLLSEAEFERRYGKRLALVIPYRDRLRHLGPFLTRMLYYFGRDKLDCYIKITLHLVEQHGDAPFNCGAIRNVGFQLARESSDYTCFHDVDYLPIWADYSWPERPARLIWYGLRMAEDYDNFFGAVTLFDNAQFEKVNGYPNLYWGWGCEDLELGMRCKHVFGDFERRDGSFMPMQHRHRGIQQRTFTPEARRTHAVFERRRAHVPELIPESGLSTLQYKVMRRDPMGLNGERIPGSFRYLVDIGGPPAGRGRRSMP
jgi:hypothetical protein